MAGAAIRVCNFFVTVAFPVLFFFVSLGQRSKDIWPPLQMMSVNVIYFFRSSLSAPESTF